MIKITLSPLRIQAGQDTDLAVTLTNVGQGTCRNVVFHLDLPWQIVRLSGDGQIETERLAAGESVSELVRVRAEDIGSWAVHSSNFSYRNRQGSTVRQDDYTDLLTVEPMVQVDTAPPRFTVDLVDGELAPGRWGTLRIRLSNIGDTAVRDIGMSVRGRLRFDDDPARQLAVLSPGDSVLFPFDVLPDETGAVPVHVELTGRYGQQERPVQQRWTKKVVVGSVTPAAGPTTVLYVSANPDGTTSTYAAAEAREIRRELAKNPEFRMEERGAIGPRELTDALLHLRPRIVHFAGHGEDGYLYLEREMGQPHIVSPRSVAALFGEATDYVECVVVGACDSEALAEAVREHIDYVIAVDDRLHSSAAIAFSIGFYQALAVGEPLEKAYRLGRTQIPLQLGDGFADQPVRLYRRRTGGADVGSR
jgi:hypothetical protein